jgi:hypothetical protein
LISLASLSAADEEVAPTGQPSNQSLHSRLTIVVPAYFYPNGSGMTSWNRLISAASRIPIVAIVNPASGPGKQPDDNFIKLVNRAKGSGPFLIGYIDTTYAKRPIQDVKSEVDQWIRFYPGIRGILLDQQSSDTARLDYYAQLYDYIRKRDGLDLVVNNPGSLCAESYFSQHTSDVECLHEGHGALPPYFFPDWIANYAATGVMILPYGVKSPEEMMNWLTLADEKKFHYIYVTDATGGNPWSRLPSYWDQEVDAVEKVNNSNGSN